MDKFYVCFTSYKGRRVLPAQRVEVYRNLKYKNRVVYSIRDAKTGLVLGHASKMLLTNNCKFVVKEAGRQRVLKEKKKNVHAWIEGSFGIVHAGDDRIFSDGTKISYNPYTNSHFEMDECGEPVVAANLVWIDKGLVAASSIVRLWETRGVFCFPTLRKGDTMNELTLQELEILAVMAINAVETRSFGNGVDMHPTLVTRLGSAHSKLCKAMDDITSGKK